MPNLVFVALATGDQQSGYQAKVPDLPDLNVAGAGIADLVAAAREAILKALQRLTDEGQEWPRPTAAEAVTAASGEIPFLIDISVEDAPVRVNISIGEQLLKRID